MALTDLQVKQATPRERDWKLADGGGLYILVRPNGAKLWRMKYRQHGKEKKLAFGRLKRGPVQTECAQLKLTRIRYDRKWVRQ